MIKAYFKGLKPLVLEQIQEAKESIQIAVAWFTDQDVLDILVEKRKQGIQVQVLISNDRKNFEEAYSLDFTKLQQIGGKLIVVETSFMHHKFCIVDQQVLLTGSANYTYSGFHKNNESIIITDEQESIKDFLLEFERFIEQAIEEEGLVVSPLVQALHHQIKLYNSQISWLEVALAEAEKQLECYEAGYRVRFQQIIEEILLLQRDILAYKAQRTEKQEAKKQYQEAKVRWESFQNIIAEDTQTITKAKDDILQESLKQLYREGVKLCHPDSPLVEEAHKAQAQQIFLKLKQAYDQNDLKALQTIVAELKLGIAFGDSNVSGASINDLEAFAQQLAEQVQQLAERLSTLQNDYRYILQMGEEAVLEKHFDREEMILKEKRRTLVEEIGRISKI
ncbi:phospholipase D-like domain-containing protein [Flectobacillus major]|uniref:phospholipase D-like domain-containing protein n=1 Tax=Flectobacillus major TaxID=103 RepID=UPI0003FC972E|nr:phospholipase D-like domain-containing protein [Flectobacillus major]